MQIKIRCANCSNEEYCEFGIAVSGQWRCLCGCVIWERIMEEKKDAR